MKAEYTEGKFRELELAGTAVEWLAFSSALAEDGVRIPLELGQSSNYQLPVRHILVKHVTGRKVSFHFVSSETVILQGDPAFLDVLARTMGNLATQFSDGDHIHVDYLGDDHYVDQDSISTVLTKVVDVEKAKGKGVE